MSDELNRKRAACKGWVTRACGNIEKAVGDPHVTLTKLMAVMDDFDARLAKLDEVQDEFELSLQDESKLMEDINAAGEFRDKAMDKRGLATDKYNELYGGDIKLPKLNLPVFGGDVLQWPSFWDQFEANVDSTDLPVISKFSYLRTLLEGEPKRAIEGLSFTADHYDVACSILKDRFGRKETIIFTHIQKLLNLSVPSKCTVASLWRLNDELKAHTRSLEALGIDGKQYGVILTPLILSRVPQELRLEWSREGKGHESDLNYLLEFLDKEIQRRERSQMFQESLATQSVNNKLPNEERRQRTPTTAALHTSSMAKPKCSFCGKNHPTEKCFKLSSGPVHVRKERVKAAGLCFRCLMSGHISKGCSSLCRKCGGRHHEIICGPNFQVNPTVPPTAPSTVPPTGPPSGDTGTGTNITAASSSNPPVTLNVSVAHTAPPGAKSPPSVVLQFARVTVRGCRGVTEATVMFDTGSDRSFVSDELVKKIQPQWVDSEPVAFASFGSGKPSKSKLRDVFSVSLQDIHGTEHTLSATAVDVICAPLFRPRVSPDVLASFGEVCYADQYHIGSVVNVDILIGMDSFWRFVLPEFLGSDPAGAMAQNTVFGWVVSGCVDPCPPVGNLSVSHQLLRVNVCEDTVRSFWDLESIGILPKETVSVNPVLQHFEESIRQVDDRYEVKLPWRDSGCSGLQNNEKLAAIRLRHLDKRFMLDPELKVRYNGALQDMWSAGVVEEVALVDRKCSGPVFYLPHRPVVRESAVSTKVRPVFDASAKGYNGISLNDCMEVGPNLLNNLTEILMRFRRWKVGITADVEKAFFANKCLPNRSWCSSILVESGWWHETHEIQTFAIRKLCQPIPFECDHSTPLASICTFFSCAGVERQHLRWWLVDRCRFLGGWMYTHSRSILRDAEGLSAHG